MSRGKITRFLGIEGLLVLDEDTLYEIHRRIEEPRVAYRLSNAFQRSVESRQPGIKWLRYIIVWYDNSLIKVKAVRISGLHFPSEKLSAEQKKYRFLIDERICFRKLISRPALGLSPPSVPGLIMPLLPARPHPARPAPATTGWHILPVNSLIIYSLKLNEYEPFF